MVSRNIKLIRAISQILACHHDDSIVDLLAIAHSVVGMFYAMTCDKG